MRGLRGSGRGADLGVVLEGRHLGGSGGDPNSG